MSASLAQSFFRSLVAKGSGLFTHLDGLGTTQEPTVETEWLDFKAGAVRDGPNAGQPLADSKIKEIWSQALAGFATTQGGVLVWGLDCRKEGDPQVDQVWRAIYVANPSSFKSRLMELHHLATDPPVAGVEVTAVPDPSNATRGFVVCYIPESTHKPIRAEFAKQQYFIRAGDDFVVPSVTLLRSLFVPGSYAPLRITVHASLMRGGAQYSFAGVPSFTVTITNCGQVSVRGIIVRLRGPSESWIGQYFTEDDWVRNSTDNPTHLESPRPLYPGETMKIFHLRRGRHMALENNTHRFPAGYSQEIHLRVFGDDQPGFDARTAFDEHEVRGEAVKVCANEPIQIGL